MHVGGVPSRAERLRKSFCYLRDTFRTGTSPVTMVLAQLRASTSVLKTAVGWAGLKNQKTLVSTIRRAADVNTSAHPRQRPRDRLVPIESVRRLRCAGGMSDS